MQSSVLQGILLPFWGTSLGAACVFCLRRAPSAVLRRVLEGFAAGVMTAASVWSLLLPAIDWADMGRWSFLPAAGGFWLGVLFLRLLERLLPEAVTDRSTTMTLLAVTLHNIPEGMAVGAAYAGCVAAGAAAPAAAFTLALAIAIQNVPEGAIVALPLRTAGAGKGRAFLGGVLSGVVEPLAAGVTVLAAALIVPALPWLLGFAAGAEAVFEKQSAQAVEEAKKWFRPELLGRLDEVIVFRPLAEENLCAIAEKMLCQLEQRAARSGYRLRHTPQVGAALAARAQSAYGARELRRQVDRAVEQALANRIAAGTACVGQHWTADCAADGSIVLREDETITL